LLQIALKNFSFGGLKVFLAADREDDRHPTLQEAVDHGLVSHLRLDPGCALHALALARVGAGHTIKYAIGPFQNAADPNHSMLIESTSRQP